MRIGLAYNQKPEPASTEDPESSNDAYAEWDDPATIAAVEQALGPFGSVIRLEADQYLPQKLRSEEHTSELQSLAYLVCRLLLEKKKKTKNYRTIIKSQQTETIMLYCS